MKLKKVFYSSDWDIQQLRNKQHGTKAMTEWTGERFGGGEGGGARGSWFIRLRSRVFIAAKIHHAYRKKNDYSFFRCLNANIRYFYVR
jgi:hypothetical protein